MDLGLPDASGYEVAKKIRSLGKTDVPIIALTAHNAAFAEKSSKESGMNDFITKPLTVEKARAILRPVFRGIVPEKYKSKIRLSFNEFYSGVREIISKKPMVAKLFTLSALSWFLGIVQSYFLALSLGIDIGFTAFIFFIPIIYLLEAIPITVSGIGVRDAFLIIVFSAFMIPAELAVSFSFSILFINIILVLFSSLAWLSKR